MAAELVFIARGLGIWGRNTCSKVAGVLLVGVGLKRLAEQTVWAALKCTTALPGT